MKNYFNRINTIELDELLHGDPTWSEVVKFFKEGEFYEESYSVEAIKKYLRTSEDRKIMYDLDFSIEDMLNWRVQGETQRVASRQIFESWNEKLGFKCFGA